LAARAKRLLCVLPFVAAAVAGCPQRQATVAAADLAPAAPDSPAPPPPRETAPAGLGSLRQPAPMKMGALAPGVYAVGPFPPRETVLRPGPEDDRHLVEVYCVGCHSPAYIAMQPPLSGKQWEAEVKKMRQAFGAVIPDAAATRIATYLAAYYGPEGPGR
jgi:hypothetical protein